MSVFTNPADGAREGAQAYIAAVLDLLGERDPMAVLESAVDDVRGIIGGLSVDELRTPEAEGKWSAAQVVQHLADSELVWGYRLRMVLAQDRPTLTGYDQDLWAGRLRYADADVNLALALFEALRRTHLDILGRATDAELSRCGVHVERGEESVAHMIRLYAGHDLVHTRQLRRIRGTLRPGERPPGTA